MKKNLTELVFILDRSGSMAGLEKDTIGGFNAMIEKQKAEEGEAFISTVLFDNYSVVMTNRVFSGRSSSRAYLWTLPIWWMAPPTASSSAVQPRT